MILVVDDHSDTRKALVRLLKSHGYEAQAAGCGTEALDYLRENTPRLVVLDCHMPDVDGLGVLDTMRRDARMCLIPVIMFSAASSEHEGRAFELGAKEFIRKGSLDWPYLLAAMEKHMSPPLHPA